jgi:hypothetical protein
MYLGPIRLTSIVQYLQPLHVVYNTLVMNLYISSTVVEIDLSAEIS